MDTVLAIALILSICGSFLILSTVWLITQCRRRRRCHPPQHHYDPRIRETEQTHNHSILRTPQSGFSTRISSAPTYPPQIQRPRQSQRRLSPLQRYVLHRGRMVPVDRMEARSHAECETLPSCELCVSDAGSTRTRTGYVRSPLGLRASGETGGGRSRGNSVGVNRGVKSWLTGGINGTERDLEAGLPHQQQHPPNHQEPTSHVRHELLDAGMLTVPPPAMKSEDVGVKVNGPITTPARENVEGKCDDKKGARSRLWIMEDGEKAGVSGEVEEGEDDEEYDEKTVCGGAGEEESSEEDRGAHNEKTGDAKAGAKESLEDEVDGEENDDNVKEQQTKEIDNDMKDTSF
ncbi:MAG: hypothetical protein M1831_002119 [Alyxoria varia]|nr:MAG: hypothetical protein M1831_002119 [Alyxoria varia]